MTDKMAAKRGRGTAADGNAPGTSIVANSIYSVRRRRGLTLAQVAEATELDKGYLSRVERGHKSPSISTLLKIAEALDVQVGHLFGETTSDDAITVVRRDQRIDLLVAGGPVALLEAILPSSNKRRISAFMIEPGIEGDTPSADHPGDEMLFVLAGTVLVEFPDKKVELGEGDCIHFDGHVRHRLRQVGTEQVARALIVVAQDLPSQGE